MEKTAAIRINDLRTVLGGAVIHDHLDLDIWEGEVLGVIGASGTGKSVLLRQILGLLRPAAGKIEVLDQTFNDLGSAAKKKIRARQGVLFQDGALFSALTVIQNIEAPMMEHHKIPKPLLRELAAMKLGLVGLPLEACNKYPAELSGGMRKRAGLARALALDPDMLFLDEPTAGLDPIGASDFDHLIRRLQQSLGLTVVMVTHDLDSIVTVCDRIAALVDKRAMVGTLAELRQSSEPWLQDYFGGPRGRAVFAETSGSPSMTDERA